jgi:hypothetical protein
LQELFGGEISDNAKEPMLVGIASKKWNDSSIKRQGAIFYFEVSYREIGLISRFTRSKK